MFVCSAAGGGKEPIPAAKQTIPTGYGYVLVPKEVNKNYADLEAAKNFLAIPITRFEGLPLNDPKREFADWWGPPEAFFEGFKKEFEKVSMTKMTKAIERAVYSEIEPRCRLIALRHYHKVGHKNFHPADVLAPHFGAIQSIVERTIALDQVY